MWSDHEPTVFPNVPWFQPVAKFGGPRLSDPIALYAADKAAIVAQVTRPRHGVMPAWNTRLDEVTIKQLAIYVHSLGGGEMPVP